jgi:hypothetical protein
MADCALAWHRKSKSAVTKRFAYRKERVGTHLLGPSACEGAGLFEVQPEARQSPPARAAFRLVPDHLLRSLTSLDGRHHDLDRQRRIRDSKRLSRRSCDNWAMPSRASIGKRKRPRDASQLAQQIVMESTGQAEGRKEGQEGAREQ